jgi:choline-sulfatase
MTSIMTRRFVLLILLFFAVEIIYAVEKPNIVFIYTDDQSFNTIASLGNPIVKTPNFDKLVHQGVTFTNAYNQGGWHGAICVASRSMINTGQFLWNAQRKIDNLRPNKQGELTQEKRTQIESEFWSCHFKRAGYTTYFTGKWHVDIPVRILFDHVGLVRGGMPPTVESSYNRPFENKEDAWSPFDPHFQGHWSGGQHWAEALADSSIEFIKKATKQDDPFFLYLAFNSPHDPRQAPKEYVDIYPQEKMNVPLNFLPENPYKDIMGCPATLRDEKLAPYPRTEYAVRVHRREYYAIISHLDTQIGRILDALDQSGKKENTYIFLAADNGLAIGSHGLFGKQNLFEHSVKVPLIVTGPNIPQNKRIETPVYMQDIVPTTLDVSGISIPEHIQFRTLLPLIHDQKTEQYHAVYGAYMNRQRMIRKNNFKLIIYPEGNIVFLFDLKNDPDEVHNLAEKQEYATKKQELFQELLQLQKETGDLLKLKCP